MKKIINLFKEKNLDIVDFSKLYEYVLYCKEKDLGYKIPYETSNHHILPKKIFPEFENLTTHKFNSSHLTYKDHYIAHSILAQAINHPSIIGAWWGMNNLDRNTKNINSELLTPEIYSALISKAHVSIGKKMKGKVMCRLKTEPDKTIIVNKKEFDKNRSKYLANTEGKISVILKETNERIFINKEDYNRDIHLFHKTGTKVSKEQLSKTKITRNKIGEDGLTSYQRAAKKTQETFKNRRTEDEIKKYYKDRVKKGEEHANYGKIMVNNGVENKFIYKNELDEYISKGFTKGGKTISQPKKNKDSEDFLRQINIICKFKECKPDYIMRYARKYKENWHLEVYKKYINTSRFGIYKIYNSKDEFLGYFSSKHIKRYYPPTFLKTTKDNRFGLKYNSNLTEKNIGFKGFYLERITFNEWMKILSK